MKKFVALLVVAILTLSMLAGCGSSMKDGTYRVEQANFDSHGWKDYVEVVVSGGKITEVAYDSQNDDGMLKSQDPGYRASMEPVSGTYPGKFQPELAAQLVEKQDVKKVQTVAGATNSSDSFRVLATEALKNAKAGNLDVVKLG